MSQIDEPPTWAPRGAQPSPGTRHRARPPRPARGRGGLLEGVLTAVVLMLLGVGVYAGYRQWRAEPLPPLSVSGTVASDPADPVSEPTSRSGAVAVPPDDRRKAAAPSSPTSVPGEPAANADCQVRCSRIKAGILYLEGALPDQAAYDEHYRTAVATMGGDESRVVNNTEIVAGTPAVVDVHRVYIDDVILFEPGSAELDPVQAPVLNAGVAYLLQDPDVTVIIIGRTDADGDPETNYQLSLQRAWAVKHYAVAAGAPADRILVVPRGETDASGEPVAEDRRVEFQLGRVDQPPPEGAVDVG